MCIIGVIISVITFGLGIIIGFHLNKRLSDRAFLVNEIYSPLYEEIKVMCKNISDCKDCYSRRYGRPDYSAPLPRDKMPGYVRTYLMQTGKYVKIPKNLGAKLDDYYSECQEWNSELDVFNLSRDWREGKINDIKVIDEGRGIIIEYAGGRKEERESLVGARDYKKYEGLKEIDYGEARNELEKKQKYLISLSKELLSELQDKIREPSPLFGLKKKRLSRRERDGK